MKRIERNLWLAVLGMCIVACAPNGEDDSTTHPSEVSTPTAEGESTVTTTSDSVPQEAPVETPDDLDIESAQPRLFGTGTSCRANSCANGGRCVELWLGFRCECPAGFTGSQCQTPSAPATCLSSSPTSAGFCGGYFCKTSTTRFASGFNTSGKCGNARDFMCGGSLNATAQRCSVDHALDADPTAAVSSCIKATPAVAAARLSNACVDCFVAAEQCCVNNNDCLVNCLLGQGKACDDAKRAAGCTSQLFSCAGLPTPL